MGYWPFFHTMRQNGKMTTHQLLKRIAEILKPNNTQRFYDFLLHTTEDRGLFLRSGCCKSKKSLNDVECGEITTVLVALNQCWIFETTDYYENPESEYPVTKIRLQISLFDLLDEESLNREIRRSIAAGFGYLIKINLEDGLYEVLSGL